MKKLVQKIKINQLKKLSFSIVFILLIIEMGVIFASDNLKGGPSSVYYESKNDRINKYLSSIPKFLLNKVPPSAEIIEEHSIFDKINISEFNLFFTAKFYDFRELRIIYNVMYFVNSLKNYPEGDYYFVGNGMYITYIMAKAMAQNSQYFDRIHFLPISRDLIKQYTDAKERELFLEFLQKEISINENRKYIYLIDTLSTSSYYSMENKINENSLLKLAIIINNDIATNDHLVIPFGIPEKGIDFLERNTLENNMENNFDEIVNRLKKNKHQFVLDSHKQNSALYYPFFYKDTHFLNWSGAGLNRAYLNDRWGAPAESIGAFYRNRSVDKKFVKFSNFNDDLVPVPDIDKLNQIIKSNDFLKMKSFICYRKYFFNFIKTIYNECIRIKSMIDLSRYEYSRLLSMSLNNATGTKEVIDVLNSFKKIHKKFLPQKIEFKSDYHRSKDSVDRDEKKALALAKNISLLDPINEIVFSQQRSDNFNSICENLDNKMPIENVTLKGCNFNKIDKISSGSLKFLKNAKRINLINQYYDERSYYDIIGNIDKVFESLITVPHVELRVSNDNNPDKTTNQSYISKIISYIDRLIKENNNLQFLHLQIHNSKSFFKNIINMINQNKNLEDLTLKLTKRENISIFNYSNQIISNQYIFNNELTFHQNQECENTTLKIFKIDLYNSSFILKEKNDLHTIFSLLALNNFKNLEKFEIKLKFDYERYDNLDELNFINNSLSEISDLLPMSNSKIKCKIENKNLLIISRKL